MSKILNVGFIGCGVMGSTLAAAAAKTNCKLFVSDRDTDKTLSFADNFGAEVSNNTLIAKKCDFIFLAVKPQIIDSVVKEIAPAIAKRNTPFTVVSMAAGVSIERIASLLTEPCPIIRIMPNTPARIGEGVILYCSEKVNEESIGDFRSLMLGAGRVDYLPEKLIDAASALSGCGPAYVYLFIEALADGAVDCGLPRDKALLYAAQTVKGAANMVLETGRHPGELKDAVCSPGGTTIEGIRALEEGGFRAASMNAVIAAYEKTVRMK